jgi:hypothetical protein
MLAVVGQPSLQALVDTAVPGLIRSQGALDLEAAESEAAVTAALRELASRNRVLRSMIGMGYYDTHVPPVVKRNVLENPAWYTAYTPYQPTRSSAQLPDGRQRPHRAAHCRRIPARRGHGGRRGDDPDAAQQQSPQGRGVARRR